MPYGASRYGDTIYAGEGAGSPEPPVPTPAAFSLKPPRGSIGCGSWSAYLTPRGGGAPLAEIPFASLGFSRVLDGSAQCSLSIPLTGHHRTACCAVLSTAEPWRDEVVIYRDNDVAFVGPLVSVEVGTDGGRMTVQDLFHWTERRFISTDLFFSSDASVAFEGIFDAAMAPDTSPNIEMIAHASGVEVVRTVMGKEFQRASDLLRELARTAVDFTTIGRQVIVGGKEVFEPGIGPGASLIVHDEGVSSVTVTKDGSQFATDVAVIGEPVFQGADRIFGRATRSALLYGLVQQSFAELEITDTPSADANALARLESMQPAPLLVSVTFTPSAAFSFKDLIPGRRGDMRISEAAGCLPVMGAMRLRQVGVNVSLSDSGVTEQVTGDFVPLGVSEDA